MNEACSASLIGWGMPKGAEARQAVQCLCTGGRPPVVPEQWLGELPTRSLIQTLY